MNGTHVRTAWSRKILELLADGDWHDREQIITEAAKVVPPGVAFRVGESARLRRRTQDGTTRTRGDDATSTSTGARTIARAALNSLVRPDHGQHVERSAQGLMVRLAR